MGNGGIACNALWEWRIKVYSMQWEIVIPAMFQCLANKAVSKKSDGFTLIEMLVVISIIGVLSAIAVPSFMGQVNKAKETEAKIALNALTKSQQIFYVENSRFADKIWQLEFYDADRDPSTLDKIETDNYVYLVVPELSLLNGRVHLALSRKKEMKSYGTVVHWRDGQLEDCGLLSGDISEEHSFTAIMQFAFDAIANYQQYCS